MTSNYVSCADRATSISRGAAYALAALAAAIGLGIASVSVTVNYSYGLARGETWAALAVLAAIGATVAPGCIPGLPRGSRRSAYLALALCLAVSGLNALGAASTVRTTAAVMADDASDLRTRARDAYARAERELAALVPARPATELQAEIDRLMASRRDLVNDCNGWQPDVRARAVCLDVNALRPELARAYDRTRLRGDMDRATDELRKLDGRRMVANADAAMLAAAMAVVGVAVSEEAANRIASLVAALLTEVGGGLFLSMAVALVTRTGSFGCDHRTRTAGVAAPNRPERPAPDTPVLSASEPVSEGSVSGPPDAPDASANERILRELAARSGVLFGSQRAIGAAVGLSKSRTNEALNELAYAGRVRLTTTPKGTVVELIDGGATA